MPLPVIGGFTQDEGVALGAMLSSGTGKAYLNLNESIHGFLLDNGVLCYAVLCCYCFPSSPPSGRLLAMLWCWRGGFSIWPPEIVLFD
jgi:hypothetical protein